MLRRKNVLSGLMFVAIAAIGLWVSRSYPIGTALRMGTGYVPRLLCWLLMGLGVIVLVQGLLETHPPEPARERTPEDGVIAQLRPVVVVTLALIAFGADARNARAGALDPAAGTDREPRDARAQALGDARRRRRAERADLA